MNETKTENKTESKNANSNQGKTGKNTIPWNDNFYGVTDMISKECWLK